MSPEISERSFEEAIECALLERGLDACDGDMPVVREPRPPYGGTPPGLPAEASAQAGKTADASAQAGKSAESLAQAGVSAEALGAVQK